MPQRLEVARKRRVIKAKPRKIVQHAQPLARTVGIGINDATSNGFHAAS